MSETKDLPPIEDWFTKVHLYTPYSYRQDADSLDYLVRLQIPDFRFRMFCVDCGKESVFHWREDVHVHYQHLNAYKQHRDKLIAKELEIENRINEARGHAESLDQDLENQRQLVAKAAQDGWDYVFSARYFSVQFACGMSEGHRVIYLFHVSPHSIQKIGQGPRISAVVRPDLERYRHELSADDMSELKRAVELSSHDVHIGAYVYIRRILERLVEGVVARLSDEGKLNEREVARIRELRFEDRIKEIRQEVPDALVENRKMYGILSRGIHELSEEDCGRFFPVLLAGIRLILDERSHLRDLETRRKEISTARRRIEDELKAE